MIRQRGTGMFLKVKDNSGVFLCFLVKMQLLTLDPFHWNEQHWGTQIVDREKCWYSTILACEVREKQLSDGNQRQWKMLDLSLIQYPRMCKTRKWHYSSVLLVVKVSLSTCFCAWSQSHWKAPIWTRHEVCKKESLPGIFPVLGLNHMLHSE